METPGGSLEPAGRSSFGQITDASLVALGEHCNKLEALAIQGCDKVSDEGCITLLQGCRELKHLNLREVTDLTEVRSSARGGTWVWSYSPIPDVSRSPR